MKCRSKRKDGGACGAAAGESGYCYMHDPARAKERAEARRRGGKNRQTPKASGEPWSLDGPERIRELLERAVADTLVQENSAQRSRTLGYLAGMAIKLLEIADFEERLSALESLMAGSR